MSTNVFYPATQIGTSGYYGRIGLIVDFKFDETTVGGDSPKVKALYMVGLQLKGPSASSKYTVRRNATGKVYVVPYFDVGSVLKYTSTVYVSKSYAYKGYNTDTPYQKILDASYDSTTSSNGLGISTNYAGAVGSSTITRIASGPLTDKVVTIPKAPLLTKIYGNDPEKPAEYITDLTHYRGASFTLTPLSDTDNYTFIGWYKDSSFTTPASFPFTPTSADGGTLNFYAGWKEKIGPTSYTKIDGAWVQGPLRVKVNGEWAEVTEGYIKVGGEWKPIE